MAKWKVRLVTKADVTLTVTVEADDEDAALELAEQEKGAGKSEDDWMITELDYSGIEAKGRAIRQP